MDPDEPNVVYKECMRNHAEHIGLFGIDGCQEYMPDQEAPGQNLCAACQCNRSFHRRIVLESDVGSMESTNNRGMQDQGGMDPKEPSVVYKECMRNHAEHIGLFGIDGCQEYMSDQETPGQNLCAACHCNRSFHRRIVLQSDVGSMESTNNGGMQDQGETSLQVRFSAEQEQKMAQFAESLGWKLPAVESDDDEVGKFCNEIGISRESFKAWVEDHKNQS